MSEEREVVERKDGYTMHIELKRGTGTRDQDKLSGTVHAETMEELNDRARGMSVLLKKRAEDVRDIQPGEDDADE